MERVTGIEPALSAREVCGTLSTLPVNSLTCGFAMRLPVTDRQRPRGNGRSDRPRAAAAYADTEFVADTLAVMDACEVERAVVVGISNSSWTALLAAAFHPDRVLGVVAIASCAPELMPWPAERAVHDFDAVLDTEEGWARENRHYWLRDGPGYAEFFFGELLSEPHSAKQREDCISWAMETSPETVLAYRDARRRRGRCWSKTAARFRALRVPGSMAWPPSRGR
jgi:pimeloyl-ACP methyl ester carboxylesterase